MAAKNHKGFFTKVKVARELLREKAEEIIHEYIDIAQKAKAAGDYETAAKQLQWLLEHLPSEDDGTRVVDSSVDKQIQAPVQDVRPAIQIGIVVGGSTPKQIATEKPTKALPMPTSEVVEAE